MSQQEGEEANKATINPKKSKKNTVKKENSKKRKRISPEDQLQVERKERYDKLVYKASKALHKEAKVVKSFECQKLIRKLKDNVGGDSSDSTAAAAATTNPKLEQRLAYIKGFSLDHIVQVCLERLGIPNLNPQPQQQDHDDKGSHTKSDHSDDTELVERMLQHKRLVSAMEDWNTHVTEYRRWFLRRQDQVADVPAFVKESMRMTAGNSNKNSKKQESSNVGGLFVCLGGATMEEDEPENPLGYYGPGGDVDEEYAAMMQKKNRPGQRSRKAKAMAMEAKKEGRKWDSSLNWREKKAAPPQKEETRETPRSATTRERVKADSAQIANMGKTWKEEGKEHPSWAARQSQKTGIVAFAGKKITFD